MEMFNFGSLSSGYGGNMILKELSGRIEAGKITALIGPNGSGKSTLLKTLGGFHRYSGSLTINNREIRGIPRRDFGRMMGIVTQQANIKSPFSVYDVIAFGRLPYHGLFSGMTQQDSRIVTEAAETTGISHLLFRRITELSGGERQRALFSMVLAQDPDVYLLDEPTSALDPNQSIRIFSVLRELADKGKTVIVAAHDINTSIPFSDSFIALKDGLLMAEGPAVSLDEKVLDPLYDTKFVPYTSAGGNITWHPSVN